TFKKDAFASCPDCGLAPKTDFEGARALILSEKTVYDKTEIGRTIEELEEISKAIKSGRPYPIDGEEQKIVVREYWKYLKSQPPPRKPLKKYLLWGSVTGVIIAAAILAWWLM
ncbi:hypothetical protein, partial [Kaarinaea lacus]